MSLALKNPAAFLALFLVVLAFVFPVGLYPFQDLFRDALTFAAAAILFCWVLSSTRFRFSLPIWSVFLLFFAAALAVNYLYHSPAVSITYNLYAFALILCAMTAVATSSMASTIGKEPLVNALAWFVVVVTVLSAVLGLARYYGVLNAAFPLITEVGDRLIGPMGQPNLMAVLAALGFCATLYLRETERLQPTLLFYFLAALIFAAGTLTISRTWLIALVIVFGPLLYFLIIDFYQKYQGSARSNPRRAMDVIFLLFLLISISVLLPKIDAHFIDAQRGEGSSVRESVEEVHSRKELFGSSGRINEWSRAVSGLSSLENIWVGQGVGRYGSYSDLLVSEEGNTSIQTFWNHAHNIYLNVLIEWGVVGFLVLLALSAYIGMLFLCRNKSPDNRFLMTILAVLIFHNLVEFSLWYMPFLAVFVVSLTLLDRQYLFSFSSHWVRRILALMILGTFVPIALYMGRDMLAVTRIMYKESPNVLDQMVLRDSERSSLVGDGAMRVQILRFSPPVSGVKGELARVQEFAHWRAEPVFVVRLASLTAASGDYASACDIISRSVTRYTYMEKSIRDELTYLSDHYPVEPKRLESCFSAD